jgi:hypothetical protein
MGSVAAARRLDFEVATVQVERPIRQDRLRTPKVVVPRGPQKYAELDLRRRRAQIRARRTLGLV